MSTGGVRITLGALNAMSVPEFTAALAGVFAHSPWVAQRAAALRRFCDRGELQRALCRQLAEASTSEQDALVRAYPGLGARGAQRAQLQQSSVQEHGGAGLEACTDAQFAELLRLNDLYRARFGFPCVPAVRGHTPDALLAAMTQRLHSEPDTERTTALEHIKQIADSRLQERLAPESAGAAQATQ